MSLIKNTNHKKLINDLIFNTTALIFMHVIINYKTNKNLFHEDSLYAIVGFLLGIGFYWIVLVNFIPRQ